MYKSILQAAFLAAFAAPAMAHTGLELGGIGAGLLHPLLGLDHLAVMLAVGAWAGVTCGRLAWLPQIAFPLFMAAGAVLAYWGLPLAGTETGIAGSVLVVGLLLLGLVRLPAAAAGLLVALFAVLHGSAHGAEMPEAARPWAYGLGFIAATAVLHLGGFALAKALERFHATALLRGTGAVVGLFGAWLVWAG